MILYQHEKSALGIFTWGGGGRWWILKHYFKLIEFFFNLFCFWAPSGSWSKIAHMFSVWFTLEPASPGSVSTEHCRSLSKPFQGWGCRCALGMLGWACTECWCVLVCARSRVQPSHGVTVMGKQMKCLIMQELGSCMIHFCIQVLISISSISPVYFPPKYMQKAKMKEMYTFLENMAISEVKELYTPELGSLTETCGIDALPHEFILLFRITWSHFFGSQLWFIFV